METGNHPNRFRKHQLWAIGVTVFVHVIFAGWLLFTNIMTQRQEKEYELLLETIKEKQKLQEEVKELEKSMQDKAEESVDKMLTHMPSRIMDADEDNEFKETTEELVKEFEEKIADNKKSEKKKSQTKTAIPKKEIPKKDIVEVKKKKNVFFVGKSSIAYYLKNRYKKKLPIPIYKCKGGGQVVVTIFVDEFGTVIEAEVDKVLSSSASNCMKEAALQAALTSVFSEAKDGNVKQKGRIVYKFVPQD